MKINRQNLFYSDRGAHLLLSAIDADDQRYIFSTILVDKENQKLVATNGRVLVVLDKGNALTEHALNVVEKTGTICPESLLSNSSANYVSKHSNSTFPDWRLIYPKNPDKEIVTSLPGWVGGLSGTKKYEKAHIGFMANGQTVMTDFTKCEFVINLQYLKMFAGEAIKIKYSGSTSPLLIEGDISGASYVVMPIRI